MADRGHSFKVLDAMASAVMSLDLPLRASRAATAPGLSTLPVDRESEPLRPPAGHLKYLDLSQLARPGARPAWTQLLWTL